MMDSRQLYKLSKRVWGKRQLNIYCTYVYMCVILSNINGQVSLIPCKQVDTKCTLPPHLDNRVVDVDGRHWEVVLFGELVESVYASDALLHHSTYVLSRAWGSGRGTLVYL